MVYFCDSAADGKFSVRLLNSAGTSSVCLCWPGQCPPHSVDRMAVNDLQLHCAAKLMSLTTYWSIENYTSQCVVVFRTRCMGWVRSLDWTCLINRLSSLRLPPVTNIYNVCPHRRESPRRTEIWASWRRWRRERAASESCEPLTLKPSRSCRRPETSSAWRARSAETTRWTPTHFMPAFYILHPVCQIHCHFAGSGSRLVIWSGQKPSELIHSTLISQSVWVVSIQGSRGVKGRSSNMFWCLNDSKLPKVDPVQ